MRDRSSFDPLGSFIGACFAILVGAVLLTIAVHLIAGLWPWLLGLLLVGAIVGGLLRFAAWRRGQRW